MAHINVTVPDELLAEAKERGICFSQLLQRSIREVVDCTHDDELTCERCGESIDRYTIAFAALKRFCGDVMWELDVAVSRGVTGEGAARIVKSVAERHDAAVGAAAAERHQGLATAMGPLPRPSRAARQAWRDRDDEVNYDTTRRRAS